MELRQRSTDTQTELSTPEPSIPPQKQINLPNPEICVICLDQIADKAIALPCLHDHFHFTCLGTWLQRQQTCPLCKCQVQAVRYDTEGAGSKLFELPQDEATLPFRPHASINSRSRNTRRGAHPSSFSHHSSALKREADRDPTLAFRRHVYEHNLYSLHVGSNRHSRYLPSSSIKPESVARNLKQASRARMFVRRELKVFNFLYPTSPRFIPTVAVSHNTDDLVSLRRRATNSEFLLEYIIAILVAIPIKGSEGQAETLLSEYLGRRNARLFWHELEAWLRSPFERLMEWDSVVQYQDVPVRQGDVGSVGDEDDG